MITKEDIWAKTNGGQYIIEFYYPQAREAFLNPKKKFKVRNENTPSTSVKFIGDCWFVTDFGNEEKGKNAIQIFMEEEGISDYYQALNTIGERFNIGTTLSNVANKPDIEYRDAKPEELEGSVRFHFRESGFTESEIKCLCPIATKETLQSLSWYAVEWIERVKDRKVRRAYSNANFYIFMRECAYTENGENKKFYKIYEPLNPEKRYRFSYTGQKPQDYINGLRELQREYGNNEEEKLECAIICSGERDAICAKALGYSPIWFNSETHAVSSDDYWSIKKYVDEIYNIPDLDETGVRRGKELALEFIEIKTIWLPKVLKHTRDWRGRPRKDFRDWMDLHAHHARTEFKKLMNLADPAQFWKLTKNGPTISKESLINFLQLNGFCTLYDKNIKETQFIQINGNVVSRVTGKEIRTFIISWARDHGLKVDIRDKIIDHPATKDATLEALQSVDLDFSSADEKRQLFFFEGCSVEVSKQGYRVFKGKDASELQHYVWEDNVIKHKFKLLDPLFDIKWKLDDDGNYRFSIDIKNKSSKVLCYLINTSRLYWKKEMEDRFETEAERRKYKLEHQFCINGEGLTDKEIEEQVLNLINKLYTIGYMSYKFKQLSRAFAPMCMDYKIGENNESNGGSGKSVFCSFFKYFMKMVKLSGRDPKLMENNHVFEAVNKHTDIVFIDDCHQNMKLSRFYDIITSDMNVNPKHEHSFTLDYMQSPKLIFSTNFVPGDFDPSSERRMIYVNFSDYYHQKTEYNEYRQTRTIADDFGKDLFGHEYTDEEWNADMNLILQCVHFYLSLPDDIKKIQPPMTNIYYRRKQLDIGSNFIEWASEKFAEYEGNENLDHFIEKQPLFEDYRSSSNITGLSAMSFKKKLIQFCDLCEWIAEFNPKDLAQADGRIIKKNEFGAPTEHIFIRTKKAQKIIQERQEENRLKALNDKQQLFDDI